MLQIRGKYNTADVFTDNIDQTTISQVIELCNQEFVDGNSIKIMPDCHAGAGCVVGTTMTIKDKIVPNLVGVDIGCGMEYVQLNKKFSQDQIGLKLDEIIKEYVPSGFSVRNKAHNYLFHTDIEDLICDEINFNRAKLSIGTLGGGNHFIELDQDENGNQILVIHSGSRNLGKQVAEYYQKKAIEYHKNYRKYERETLVSSYKLAGLENKISDALKSVPTMLPEPLCYLEGDLMNDYLHDMEIAQEFALWNRKAMTDVILDALNIDEADRFTSIHNYIDMKNMIMRKGATSAQVGERLIIPMNMRDGSLICIGKGNSNWNFSAPHGAGRIMARGQAKRTLKLEDFQNSMIGVYTTSVRQDTLDESPMVYKPMDEIIENIGDTVDIVKVIKPIYNFKAGEG